MPNGPHGTLPGSRPRTAPPPRLRHSDVSWNRRIARRSFGNSRNRICSAVLRVWLVRGSTNRKS